MHWESLVNIFPAFFHVLIFLYAVEILESRELFEIDGTSESIMLYFPSLSVSLPVGLYKLIVLFLIADHFFLNLLWLLWKH